MVVGISSTCTVGSNRIISLILKEGRKEGEREGEREREREKKWRHPRLHSNLITLL